MKVDDATKAPLQASRSRTTAERGESATRTSVSDSATPSSTSTSRKPSPTVIDLFSGAGGMTLGFQQAGFLPVLAVDSDADAIRTHAANFPGESICTDIRTIENFPDADVVVGGPPCQGFSLLGKQIKRERTENFLWREFMRCVEQARPFCFVIENVPEFLKDAAFAGVREESERLGYRLVHRVLNAADYGVPQKRLRTIIIGSRIGMPSLPEPTHQQEKDLFSDLPSWRTVRDAIGDLPLEPTDRDLHNSRNVTPLSIERYKHIPLGGNRHNLPPHLQPDCWRNKDPRGGGSADLMGRMHWDKPSLTIRTQFLKPEKGRYLHPEAHRSITVREGARLQTFPDSFTFTGSTFQIVKQIGNAVPVELARNVAVAVLSHIRSHGMFIDPAVLPAP
ncbi:DNA cytosine methyltransferase [Actinoplanes sp. NPDC051859]|uniref:DNA cytosine methyltransferase n=1 Tax=Actinoplanes sp. NPDC051859 TaxID=3363909 RepID=UPI0037927EB4